LERERERERSQGERERDEVQIRSTPDIYSHLHLGGIYSHLHLISAAFIRLCVFIRFSTHIALSLDLSVIIHFISLSLSLSRFQCGYLQGATALGMQHRSTESQTAPAARLAVQLLHNPLNSLRFLLLPPLLLLLLPLLLLLLLLLLL
jgi:hypothetical protein